MFFTYLFPILFAVLIALSTLASTGQYPEYQEWSGYITIVAVTWLPAVVLPIMVWVRYEHLGTRAFQFVCGLAMGMLMLTAFHAIILYGKPVGGPVFFVANLMALRSLVFEGGMILPVLSMLLALPVPWFMASLKKSGAIDYGRR